MNNRIRLLICLFLMMGYTASSQVPEKVQRNIDKMAEQYKVLFTYYIYIYEQKRIDEKYQVKQRLAEDYYDATAYMIKEYTCLSNYFSLKTPGVQFYEAIEQLTKEWNDNTNYNPRFFTVFDSKNGVRSLSFMKALDFYNHSERLKKEIDIFKNELKVIYISETNTKNRMIKDCLERESFSDVDEIWKIKLNEYKEIEF